MGGYTLGFVRYQGMGGYTHIRYLGWVGIPIFGHWYTHIWSIACRVHNSSEKVYKEERNRQSVTLSFSLRSKQLLRRLKKAKKISEEEERYFCDGCLCLFTFTSDGCL